MSTQKWISEHKSIIHEQTRECTSTYVSVHECTLVTMISTVENACKISYVLWMPLQNGFILDYLKQSNLCQLLTEFVPNNINWLIAGLGVYS